MWKAWLVAVVAAAVAVGLALPVPHHKPRPALTNSQFAAFELGTG